MLGYLGTAASALSANTYYYAVHSMSSWTTKASVVMRVLQDPNQVVTTSASATGEHRTCYNLVFTNSGSYVASKSTQTVGEFIPMLIYSGAAAGTVNASSQPYSTVSANGGGQIANGIGCGQQVTSAGGTAYVAVQVEVTRFNNQLDPNQPLKVEIRHGAGSATGGGSLDATATVLPSQLVGSGFKATKVEVDFTSFTSAGVQYVELEEVIVELGSEA